jgi:hypothetical protein
MTFFVSLTLMEKARYGFFIAGGEANDSGKVDDEVVGFDGLVKR